MPSINAFGRAMTWLALMISLTFTALLLIMVVTQDGLWDWLVDFHTDGWSVVACAAVITSSSYAFFGNGPVRQLRVLGAGPLEGPKAYSLDDVRKMWASPHRELWETELRWDVWYVMAAGFAAILFSFGVWVPVLEAHDVWGPIAFLILITPILWVLFDLAEDAVLLTVIGPDGDEREPTKGLVGFARYLTLAKWVTAGALVLSFASRFVFFLFSGE